MRLSRVSSGNVIRGRQAKRHLSVNDVRKTPETLIQREDLYRRLRRSVLVVSQAPAIQFGERSDLRFARLGIIRPDTRQVGFVDGTMLGFL